MFYFRNINTLKKMEKEIVQEIMSDLIDDPENAMRSELNRDELFELADNIKQNGLINPITVRPKNSRFEVVAGHRRFAACKIAGKIRIACVVRELTDKEAFAVMAAENLERQDVDPVDEAVFIQRYIDQTGQTIPEVAKSLRRSVAYVETRLAVGQMPDYMKEYLKAGFLKLGAAMALVQITNDAIRHVWVDMAVRDGVSVAQAEYWLHGWKIQQLPGGENSETPPGGFEPDAPHIVEFVCAIDGQKYDARLCKTLIVAESNLEIFNAFVSEFRKSPSDL
jgi:ParB family transcriptional regulator, chromosome partitioning protein